VFSALKVAGSETGFRINESISRRTNIRRRLLLCVITGLIWFIKLYIGHLPYKTKITTKRKFWAKFKWLMELILPSYNLLGSTPPAG